MQGIEFIRLKQHREYIIESKYGFNIVKLSRKRTTVQYSATLSGLESHNSKSNTRGAEI